MGVSRRATWHAPSTVDICSRTFRFARGRDEHDRTYGGYSPKRMFFFFFPYSLPIDSDPVGAVSTVGYSSYACWSLLGVLVGSMVQYGCRSDRCANLPEGLEGECLWGGGGGGEEGVTEDSGHPDNSGGVFCEGRESGTFFIGSYVLDVRAASASGGSTVLEPLLSLASAWRVSLLLDIATKGIGTWVETALGRAHARREKCASGGEVRSSPWPRHSPLRRALKGSVRHVRREVIWLSSTQDL